MFSGGMGFETSSGKSRSTSTGLNNSTYTAGTWDTLDSLVATDNRLQNFDLDMIIDSANNRAAFDTENAVSNIFKQYSETALPSIFGAQAGAGAYGGSSTQLMANDAFARTVNQSAELQLGVASSYIGQSLQARDQLLQQFSQLLQGNLASSGGSKTRTYGTEAGTVSGKKSNASFGFGGGGGNSPTFTGGGGSDIRIKTDITQVGMYEELGVPKYHFRYKTDPAVLWEGVMAQDLLEKPELAHAVHERLDGFYMVDYNALGIAMVAISATAATPEKLVEV